MGPTWGRQDPDGPHVGPMNFAIWDDIKEDIHNNELSKWLQTMLFAVVVWMNHQVDGLVQDCSNSIANTLELLQSCS